MKKIIGILTIVAVLVILCVIFLGGHEDNIVYSWSMDAIEDEEFMEILKEYEITTVYQDFSSDYLASFKNEFVDELKEEGVDAYHLAGEPEWGCDSDAEGMKKEIDKVLKYNKNVKQVLAGIVFDVEPYLDNEENFDFELYVASMKEAYRYANASELRMVIAIPVWFDSESEELLESLIRDASDGISLMNYNIRYTKKNMALEVELAEKYGKEVDTIYEIEFDDEEYFSSYKEIDEDFDAIRKEYQPVKVRKAYHYYAKMKKYY